MMSSNLHTLDDNGAENYIEENLHDDIVDEESRLLQPPIPAYSLPYNQPVTIPYQQYQYYVQHSIDENMHRSVYQRESPGKFGMSPVRRMFCLLVIFDCLLTFLMWVIYLQIIGDLNKNIVEDVIHYTIKTSFFDVVVLSVSRGALLLLFYSFTCKSTKWYIVALTTSSNTVFLMAKVFLTSFGHGQPLNYLLIIFSFVICWCEAWHFDFQVIPNELNTNDKVVQASIPGIAGDRSIAGRSLFKGGTSAFYTPYGGSIYQARSPSQDTDSSISNFSEELNELEETDHQLIRISKDTVHMVFRMLYINDGWILEREERDNIIVTSRMFEGVGKVYKLEGIIEVPSKVLDRLFWEDVDSQPSWNASVRECQIVRRVNNKTDILYSVAAEAGAGIIASRDFVSLRRRKRKGPLTLLCAASVETDLIPVKKSIIRGRNGPGGWVLRDLVGEPSKTEFIWLLNTELKGWLPQRLVEQSLAGVMIDTARDIRKHASTLPRS